MAARALALATMAGTASATYGDTHYGAHPTITEAPHMVRALTFDDRAAPFDPGRPSLTSLARCAAGHHAHARGRRVGLRQVRHQPGRGLQVRPRAGPPASPSAQDQDRVRRLPAPPPPGRLRRPAAGQPRLQSAARLEPAHVLPAEQLPAVHSALVQHPGAVLPQRGLCVSFLT